jgi:EAL domain-containing protein (putative c-di-GMP-specific phosphodiesterase class I)
MRDNNCEACQSSELDIEFTMAFQPIVDLRAGRPYAYEALVRGANGEGAARVLEQITEKNRYAFDQAIRVRAIELAAALHAPAVSINFMANAVYDPATCIRASLAAARRCNYPANQLIFELTEGERVDDAAHLRGIIAEYRRHGFRTAIDDFGAGYSGLNLLAEFQPDIIKIDRALVTGVEGDTVRRAILGGIMQVADAVGVAVVAEGVETRAEKETLMELGIFRQQGYLYARPEVERLPEVSWQD